MLTLPDSPTSVVIPFCCLADSKVQVFSPKDGLSPHQLLHLQQIVENPDFAYFEASCNIPFGTGFIRKVNARVSGTVAEMRVWWRSRTAPFVRLTHVRQDGTVTKESGYNALAKPPTLREVMNSRTYALDQSELGPNVWSKESLLLRSGFPAATDTVEVEVPAPDDQGHTVTLKVPALCPHCGVPRFARRWRQRERCGPEYLEVDCWDNHCQHSDTYTSIRHEAVNPSSPPHAQAHP